MRIEDAKLFGWISPTGQDAGFKLPIFINNERSNSLLIQEIDKQGRISEFSTFETKENVEESDKTEYLMRGDLAFWCFGLGDGSHLAGRRDDISSEFRRINWERDEKVYVAMQIVNALDLEYARLHTERLVYQRLAFDLDSGIATNWLDSEVFTLFLRSNIITKINIKRRKDLIFSFLAEVQTVTDGQLQIILPDWVSKHMKEKGDWEGRLVESMQEIAGKFDVAVRRGIVFPPSDFDPVKIFQSADVASLKDQAILAFSKQRNTHLTRASKSYYLNDSGSTRVVCTFSSRYENKGKRKYWYGYHAIWDEWLSESADAHLVLGCIDRRIAFALPISAIRRALSDLRFTGEGKDKYWHLDIIDQGGEADLLDRVRGTTPLDLKDYAFDF